MGIERASAWTGVTGVEEFGGENDIRKMTSHWPYASKGIELPKLHSVVNWVFQVHLSNDCQKDIRGNITWFHRGTWGFRPVLSKCMELQAGLIKVSRSAWKRVDLYQSSPIRKKV